jgi:hypothetical protein
MRQVIRASRSRRLWSPAEVLADPGVVPATPGIYGWYFRDAPAVVPLNGCVQRHGLSLLYVGIAPRDAASPRALRDRIVDNHLCGRCGHSTLRLTLAVLLALEARQTKGGKVVLTSTSQGQLSKRINDHAFVVWTTAEEPGTLEKPLISRLRPPLNLKHNGAHPFYPCLKALRAAACGGQCGTRGRCG